MCCVEGERPKASIHLSSAICYLFAPFDGESCKHRFSNAATCFPATSSKTLSSVPTMRGLLALISTSNSTSQCSSCSVLLFRLIDVASLKLLFIPRRDSFCCPRDAGTGRNFHRLLRESNRDYRMLRASTVIASVSTLTRDTYSSLRGGRPTVKVASNIVPQFDRRRIWECVHCGRNCEYESTSDIMLRRCIGLVRRTRFSTYDTGEAFAAPDKKARAAALAIVVGGIGQWEG